MRQKRGGTATAGIVILQHGRIRWVMADEQENEASKGRGRLIKCSQGGADCKRSDDSSGHRHRDSKVLTDGSETGAVYEGVTVVTHHHMRMSVDSSTSMGDVGP